MSHRILLYSAVDRSAPGGVQRVVERLAAGLARAGHAVTVGWATPAPAMQDHPWEDWVCPLHVRGTAEAPVGRAEHLPSLARVVAGLGHRRPDLVNVHFLSEQTHYFLKLAPLFGYRTVLSAHGSDILRPEPAWEDRLPAFLRQADAVTVVSPDLERRVLAVDGIDPARVHPIPNGIDPDFWTPAPAAFRDPVTTAAPTLVTVGRLVPVKGYGTLMRALALLRRDLPAVRLCLIGTGALAEELGCEARALGLADAVTFAGALDPGAVRQRLWRADAFVLPSLSEGLPLALLEAMACGVPCVASAVGGVPDLLVGNAGLLVSPGNAEDLAAALRRVLTEAGLARSLADAGHRRSRDFTEAAATDRFERLYCRLLAGPVAHE